MSRTSTANTIPHYPDVGLIHQILILRDGRLPPALPPAIQRSQKAACALYPEARYHLWSGRALRQLIRKRMPAVVLSAFDTLTPMAYQADLARYVLLYLLGGLYVDLGIVLQKRWSYAPGRKIAACRDAAFISPGWTAIQNGLLWAEPGRPEFQQAITRICRNCQTHYYGHNPLYPTGPVLLGKAFAQVTVSAGLDGSGTKQDIGQCLCLTPEGSTNNLGYISRDGELIALRIKRLPGDLSHMGIMTGNNYNQLWNARRVYGELRSHGIVQQWTASAAPLNPLGHARQTEKGLTVTTPMKGRMNSGPYIALPAGGYCIQALFTPTTRFLWLMLEIACGPGHRVIYRKRRFSWQKKSPAMLIFPFHLKNAAENMEFRLVTNRTFRGTLSRFRLIASRMRTQGRA